MRDPDKRLIPQAIWDASKTEAVRLYALPTSIRRIASKLSVSPGTVQAMLKEAGVTIRPRGSAPGSTRVNIQRLEATGSADVVIHITGIRCPDSWCARRVAVTRRHVAPHENPLGAECPMSHAEVVLPMEAEASRPHVRTR
ncbi:helix-turn-helix domain-containing protein [Streptacidiphilus albus]|uniref:helix-turn-helix domain-containing protein n=1 Tax=Streptacidiphilus albus TaxID=105425 RepID=UPI00054B7A16|nr:hypothetical protein [Streptacidiphilus albus]